VIVDVGRVRVIRAHVMTIAVAMNVEIVVLVKGNVGQIAIVDAKINFYIKAVYLLVDGFSFI